MVFRAIVAVALLFPLIGVFLVEAGYWAPGINERGHLNGATLAFTTYTAVIVGTIWLAERYEIFHGLGATWRTRNLPVPIGMFAIFAVFAPMAAFMLFGVGGLHTILGQQGSGEFRAALTPSGGAPSYLIFKCYAPATFACVALERAKLGRLLYPETVVAGLFLIPISMSFGYKTGILMIALPAIILLYWNTSWRTLAKIGIAASCFIVVAYLLMKSDDLKDLSIFEAIFQRAFILNGGTSWKFWDMYWTHAPFASYVNTIPSIFSDRLYTMLTGFTRSDNTLWVMGHFNLLATFTSGYLPSYIMEHGHNNAANAFSEGIMAAGPVGAIIVAIIAGLIIDALYRLIDNRLKANDFIVAPLATCYFVYALVSWLLGGGISALVHSSVIVGMLSGYVLLRLLPYVRILATFREAI